MKPMPNCPKRSPRRSAAALSALVAALLACCAAQASPVVYSFGLSDEDGLRAYYVSTDWVQGAYGGYIPVSVTVHDVAEPCDITVRIQAEMTANWTGGNATVVRHVAGLGKGESAEILLGLPPGEPGLHASYRGSIELFRNGRRIGSSAPLSISIGSHSHAARSSAPPVCIFKAPVGIRSSNQVLPDGGHVEWLQLGPRSAPADWIFYAPFQAMALDMDALADAPGALLSMMASWTFAGGLLAVHVREAGDEAAALAQLFGGSPPAALGAAQETPEGVAFRACGLGAIAFVRGELPGAGQPGFDEAVRGLVVLRGALARHFHRRSSTPRDALPIEGFGRVPVYSYLAIMLLFTLAVGPVNYVVLRKLRRPKLLLVTVPGIALATTLLLASYSALVEGFALRASAEAVTWVDQGANRAYTEGRVSYYAGLAPRGGLRFSRQTIVMPAHLPRSRPGRSHRTERPVRTTLDWTDGQVLRDGWISSRRLAPFVLRSSQTTRLRLEVRPVGENLEVTNGLGADLRRLRIGDDKGRIYEAGHLAAGETAILTPITSRPYFWQVNPGSPAFVTQLLNSRGPGSGIYRAILDKNVFLELGRPADQVQLRGGSFEVVGTFPLSAQGQAKP